MQSAEGSHSSAAPTSETFGLWFGFILFGLPMAKETDHLIIFRFPFDSNTLWWSNVSPSSSYRQINLLERALYVLAMSSVIHVCWVLQSPAGLLERHSWAPLPNPLNCNLQFASIPKSSVCSFLLSCTLLALHFVSFLLQNLSKLWKHNIDRRKFTFLKERPFHYWLDLNPLLREPPTAPREHAALLFVLLLLILPGMSFFLSL